MRKAIVLIVILSLAVLSESSADEYVRDFLEMGFCAREVSLGGIAVANSSPPLGVIGNPAIGAIHPANSVGMTYITLPGLGTYNVGAATYSFQQSGTLGFAWIRLGVEDIPIYGKLSGSHEERLVNPAIQSNFTPEGTITDIEEAWVFSYSVIPLRRYRDNNLFAIGTNMKFFRQRAGDMRGGGIGWDIGVVASIDDIPQWQIEVAGVIADIFTSRMNWIDGTADVIPADFQGGLSAARNFGVFDLSLNLGVRTRYSFDVGGGAELGIRRMLFLRTGARDGEIRFGAGFKAKGVSIDYAMRLGDLHQTHLISLSL